MASTAPPESTAATPAQLLLDEEEIQVNRIMKQKPVYKISNSKKKIAADESSPPLVPPLIFFHHSFNPNNPNNFS